MERRRFLISSLAASALALSSETRGQVAASPGKSPGGKEREYYELRKYTLHSGPQTALIENYLENALIPALNRLGMSRIGAFNLSIGPETPVLYLLIPAANLETLVQARLNLERDETFLKAAAPFWNAPAREPAFDRVESNLLIAFEGWPRMTPPAPPEQKGKRILQLRTYENSTDQDHARKLEMFHSGEFEIFARNGFSQVFYGDALIGPRLPHLTYMLSFSDLAEMDHKWDLFRADPGWKTLSTSARFSFEAIVSNVSNLVLTPAPCSQV